MPIRSVELHCVGLPLQIIYYIKLKSHPSVRPHFFGRVDLRCGCKDPCQTCSNEAPVFWEHEVCFYNVLTPAVRHLRRFEYQGVYDSCRNFTYIPANRSPDTIDNINYTTFVFCEVDCPVCCGGNASDSRLTVAGQILCKSIFFL